MRIGSGIDIHAFGPGDHLTLAGVRIAHSQGIVAHSDGDVVLHALTDALLGAAGLGDIGTHFPDTDPQWRGADSARFIGATMTLLAARSWRPVNIDITVLAQAPRLGPYRAAMCANLVRLLDVPADAVNVKATTSEHLGFIGRAEGVLAHAVVLLRSG